MEVDGSAEALAAYLERARLLLPRGRPHPRGRHLGRRRLRRHPGRGGLARPGPRPTRAAAPAARRTCSGTRRPRRSPRMSEPAAASSIYDLGYRHYDGPRTGRWGPSRPSTRAASAARSASGAGRPARSSPSPSPSSPSSRPSSRSGSARSRAAVDADVEFFEHEDYFGYVQIVLVLFCAAVAPELVGRDQRNRMLSLYFSRALSRVDYALARFAALTSVMLVLTLGPQAAALRRQRHGRGRPLGIHRGPLGSRLPDPRRLGPARPR